MNGIDWLLLVTIVIITSIQTFRGLKDFDVILYEMIAFIISSALSIKLHISISELLKINPFYALIFLYIIIALILLIVANIVANLTEFSWQPFNGILCFFFGLATSWAILFVLLRIVSIATTPETAVNIPFITSESITKSVITKEILDFKTYHTIINFLNKVGSS